LKRRRNLGDREFRREIAEGTFVKLKCWTVGRKIVRWHLVTRAMG